MKTMKSLCPDHERTEIYCSDCLDVLTKSAKREGYSKALQDADKIEVLDYKDAIDFFSRDLAPIDRYNYCKNKIDDFKKELQKLKPKPPFTEKAGCEKTKGGDEDG
jgi:hypothetical protein